MVGTWNECLQLTKGGLVHILHQDDLVDPLFYSAVLDARTKFPNAALIATGSRIVASREPDSGRHLPSHAVQQRDRVTAARLLTGEVAARFLLGGGKHSCGSVVIVREKALSVGGFLPAYRPSPDEEAYLRFAHHGGIAFVAKPLYFERHHAEQARFQTWRDDDFTPSYFQARVEGARGYGSKVEAYARITSMRRVCSSMVTTAANGHRLRAIRQTALLFVLDSRLVLHWRPWATLLVAAIPGAARLAVKRRTKVETQLPAA